VTALTLRHPLSLHDALPIWIGGDLLAPQLPQRRVQRQRRQMAGGVTTTERGAAIRIDFQRDRRSHRKAGRQLIIDPMRDEPGPRSEEHTSELQSREKLVCRL